MKTISQHLTAGALAVAGTVATFGLGSVAQAAQLNANAGFAPQFGASPSYTGPNLGGATSVTFSAPLGFNNIPADYQPPGGSLAPNSFAPGEIAEITAAGLTITPNTISSSTLTPIANFLSFTTVGGPASFNVDLGGIFFEPSATDPNVLTIKFVGTITGTGFDPSPAGLLLNFNQQGGTGAVNFSATLSSPPAFTPPPPRGVPEPSTMLGILAVAGAGAFARRKR
jgi:PEP-CTERM motif